MRSLDDFNYAVENTTVLLAPQKRLETFSTSLLNYYLVTEEMDAVNHSRVREGQIHAERPAIVSPATFAKMLVEGFGEKAQSFADTVSRHADQFAFLRYGFKFRKQDVRTYEVHEPLDIVADRVKTEVAAKNDPLSVVLTGIDDGWEVCLLKFMMDTIQQSAGGHLDDFRQRGLL